jgi:hypothetical protein
MPGNVLGKSRQQLINSSTKLSTKLGSKQQAIANQILQYMGNLPAPVPAGAEAIQASQVYQQQTPMFQQPSMTPQYQLPPGMVPQYQQPTTPGFQQPSMTPGMYQQPSTMPGFQQPSIFTPAQSQQQVTPSRSLLDSMLNTPSGNVGSSYSPGSLLTGQSQQSGVLTAPGLTGSVTPVQQPPFVSTPGSTSAASILDALASANIRK